MRVVACPEALGAPCPGAGPRCGAAPLAPARPLSVHHVQSHEMSTSRTSNTPVVLGAAASHVCARRRAFGLNVARSRHPSSVAVAPPPFELPPRTHPSVLRRRPTPSPCVPLVVLLQHAVLAICGGRFGSPITAADARVRESGGLARTSAVDGIELLSSPPGRSPGTKHCEEKGGTCLWGWAGWGLGGSVGRRARRERRVWGWGWPWQAPQQPRAQAFSPSPEASKRECSRLWRAHCVAHSAFASSAAGHGQRSIAPAWASVLTCGSPLAKDTARQADAPPAALRERLAATRAQLEDWIAEKLKAYDEQAEARPAEEEATPPAPPRARARMHASLLPVVRVGAGTITFAGLCTRLHTEALGTQAHSPVFEGDGRSVRPGAGSKENASPLRIGFTQRKGPAWARKALLFEMPN